MKRRTEEEKGRMENLRNEGKTYREIAEEMGGQRGYGYSEFYLCGFFKVSRNGYYAWLKRLEELDRDEELWAQIAEYQKKSRKTYGYRRVKLWPVWEKDICVNGKVVQCVM